MFDVEDFHWWYAGLHACVLELVRRESVRLGRPLDILDAGCGTGRLCQLMSVYGNVQGVDASEDAVGFCRVRGVTANQGDLNTIQLEAERFDVISSIDVLYHAGIKDDVALLVKLRKSLKPGGMLVVNLVAHEFLRGTHDIAVHTRERYNEATLRERLIASGYEIKFITYRVMLLFPFIAVYRLVSRLIAGRNSTREAGSGISSDVSLPLPMVNSLLQTTLKLENRLLLSGIKLPLGSSVFAVARSPGTV